MTTFSGARITRAASTRLSRYGKFGTSATKYLLAANKSGSPNGPVSLGQFKGSRHEVHLAYCLAITGGVCLPYSSYYAAKTKFHSNSLWRNIFFKDVPNKKWPLFSETSLASPANLNFNYFTCTEQAGRYFLPYFCHPEFYRLGYHAKVRNMRNRPRDISIMFAGTFPASKDNAQLRFPEMPRHDVLAFISENFGADLQHFPEAQARIAFFASQVPGDNIQKHTLSLPEYLQTLARSKFSINPPGVFMPQSHNLIESMSVGTVPITNTGGYARPRMEHMKNCIAFHDPASLRAAIDTALNMSDDQYSDLQQGALSYYENHCDIFNVGTKMRAPSTTEIIVNAELGSLELMAERG